MEFEEHERILKAEMDEAYRQYRTTLVQTVLDMHAAVHAGCLVAAERLVGRKKPLKDADRLAGFIKKAIERVISERFDETAKKESPIWTPQSKNGDARGNDEG